ncbi:UNVERIFIED_CONTAM: Pentatricopeptide repeat-containing protein [Sesamum radiatum]|uniref:Pentatricopeptide repeat-containing protein n=1 Tax=Sesamum radiatum TaxID=300843 RepID=A0AAW2KHX7_SESRA
MHGEGMKANQFTYGSALRACTRLLCLEWGKQIQGLVQKGRFVDNLFVQCALVDLHSSVGRWKDACNVFEAMETRDLASWNAIIGGYAAQGLSANAISMFRLMLREGMVPDSFSFGSLLRASIGDNGSAKVRIVHGCIFQFGFGSNKFLSGSLVDAYVKSGSVACANQVYNNMQNKDVVSCTSLIKGYASEGSNCSAALQLFNEVQRNVAVDARAGQCEEAYDLVRKIPTDLDASVLRAMLGACSTHGNMNLAQIVARRLFNLEPENPVNYVVLSGIYAAAGLWNHARETRMLMETKITMKNPGYSLCHSTSKNGALAPIS